MKKAIILMMMVTTTLMFTACGITNEENSSQDAESTMSSTEKVENEESEYSEENEYAEESVSDEQEAQGEPDAEALQRLYEKADEYEYMALGYYQDMDDPTMIRDGYVPFEDGYVQESAEYLESEAHGVGIRVFMVGKSSATEANEELTRIYTDQLKTRGINAQFGETESYDNDTIAICLAAYQNEDGEEINTVLYSDIRDDGNVYMCAEIELNKAKYDDVTPDLLEEVSDAYGMDISAIAGIN